jgi:glycosyltransferase involved in cell wall biosynthesis
MKKVLIVSYYFPPSGGPGVQRVLKFAKYLPQFGYEPVVLTVADGDFPAVDESLLREIPADVKVVRTKIFEPYEIYRKLTGKKPGSAVDVENIPSGGKKRSARPMEHLAEFIRSTVFIPDARIGWFPAAVSAGIDTIRKEKIDIIYSSSPPYTSSVIARSLSGRTGKPWVMGLRDPWTGFISTPNRWFLPALIDRHLERSCVEKADAVEIAWEGIGKDLKGKYGDIDQAKLVYIPNGFDSEDYPEMPAVQNDKFTITYTGSLYGRRNPRTLLDAVKSLLNEKKIPADRVKLVFAGRFGAEVRAMFAEPGLEGIVETREYLPHEESIRLLLQSDLLALIVDESELSSEIVPGKVFEYIGSGKPVIAFAPEGAAANIIRSTESGVVVGPTDPEGAKAAILSMYSGFVDGTAPTRKKDYGFHPNRKAIMGFERREATRKLSSLFTKILER